MKLVIALLLWGLTAFAAGEKGVISEIRNADIICLNSIADLDVHISTKSGKVWFKDSTTSGNSANEAYGPVFSGVYSPERYLGEILGEIQIKGQPMYFSLIFRDRDGKPELETQLYHVNYKKEVAKYYTQNCNLR